MQCSVCGSEELLPEGTKFLPTTMHTIRIFDEMQIITCRNCHFSQASEHVDDNILEEYYKNYYNGKASKKLNTRLADFDSYWFEDRSLSQLMFISQFLNLSLIKNCYEIGIGEAAFLTSIRKINSSCKLFVSEPQSYMRDLLEDLDVIRAPDILNSFNIEDKFDLVAMSHSLEHFNSSNLSEVMNSINKSLRLGGIYFCEVPNANLAKYPLAGEAVVPHLSFFSSDSLRILLEKSGFEVLSLSTFGESQNDKNVDQHYIDRRNKNGDFEFREVVSTPFKLNIALEKDVNQRKLNILKKSRFLKKIKRIVKHRSPLALFNYPLFKFNENGEFIRVVAKKVSK